MSDHRSTLLGQADLILCDAKILDELVTDCFNGESVDCDSMFQLLNSIQALAKSAKFQVKQIQRKE